MSGGRMLTGVGGFFCAAHRDTGNGVLHGHTWEVIAWFTGRSNAVLRQRQLAAILETIDHTELPNELAWGEDIARYIAERFNDKSCVAVDLSRPSERIYARWER